MMADAQPYQSVYALATLSSSVIPDAYKCREERRINGAQFGSNIRCLRSGEHGMLGRVRHVRMLEAQGADVVQEEALYPRAV